MRKEPGTPKALVGAFIISRHRLFAELIMSALQSELGFSAARCAPTPADALEGIGNLSMGVLIFDASGDWQNAELNVREIRAAAPKAKLLIVGPEPADDTVLSFIECGVSGYISKHSSLEELFAAIKAASREEISYSPQLLTVAVSRLRELARERDELCQLSARQREILQLISFGLGNKEIANRLGISTATAKNHVHNILRKLKVNRRRDAIRKACSVDARNESKAALPGSQVHDLKTAASRPARQRIRMKSDL